MFQISRWLSLYWFVLLPLVSWSATAFLYRVHRRNLGIHKISGWFLIALIANQVFVSLLILSVLYETGLWPPIGALFAGLVTGLAAYWASPRPPDSTHDGRRDIQSVVEMVKSTSIFLLAVAIGGYVLSQQVVRWAGFWWIIPALISPLLIISWAGKRPWLALLLLILIPLTFGWQAIQLNQALPPGQWSTPMTSASCSSTVQLDLDRKYAWCTDETTGQVYRFSPRTGLVYQGHQIEYGSQVFTANANQAWIMQNPVKGLVLVENESQMQIKINLARQGAVDREGRLWVIDVSGFLWVSMNGEQWNRMKAADGLLNNTANVIKISPDGSVWVGSVGGVSILSPGQSTWQHITRDDGLPGSVIGFAFGANGATWYLWETISAYQENRRWGVSRWQESRWKHVELGVQTGLDTPSSQHAVAVDDWGRVWFVAPSYKQHTNYLGVLTPDRGVVALYTLGPFHIVPRGFPIPGFHGVVDDGNGGIFLYNPEFAPLRHWRPDQEYQEYKPCSEPCIIA
jgi:sugar lactone lactonase YvrE